MLTGEAEKWAALSGGVIIDGVDGTAPVKEKGLFEDKAWLPTKEMVIIVSAIVVLILVCCLVRACFSTDGKVSD